MNNRRYVYGIRIFLANDHTPMAELAFGNGGRITGETEVIRWDSMSERERFFINSYTFIWDEREIVREKSFTEYIQNK